MPITVREVGESAHNASLRPVVAAIDRHLSQLSDGGVPRASGAPPELLASWAELVKLLALGPAPEMRGCPACGHWGLRAATRCGFCWTALSPLPARSNAQAGSGSIDGG